MVNKRVQYTEGPQTEPLPNPTTGLQYLRRNSGNTGWELVTLNPGVANLGEVLSNGNTTDGYDIVLSVGDAISSADGYVNVSGHLSISNGLDLSNKKITSVLDPTLPQDVSTKNYVDTHIVQLTAVAPVNVDKSAAVVGVSTTSARSDHKHNITTAIAVSVGNNNAEGTATSLARSDHTHAVSDLRISGQAEGDILFFNGTNWARLGAGIDGYVLTTNGNSSGPSWKISEAVTNLSIPGQAQGDILYYNGINWVVLPPGQDGYVLTTHSTGENPTWTPKFDNISASSAAAWYVNALTGNDSNDGFTAGTALKTSEELCRRICPGFAKTVFTNLNTVINFAAGSYGALDLNIDFPQDITYFEAVVSIQCAYTSTAPMTITSVVNTVPGVSRGQITVTGGTLTHGKRIRAVSGSHEGCWTYSTGSNGGSTTNHFVGSWLDYNANTSINIDNGSSVVLDTLQVSFSKINLKIRDRGYAEIRDAQMPVDGGNYEDSTDNFLLYLAGCEIPTSEIYGDVDIYGCKISDLVGLVSGFVDFHNNYFIGRLTIYAGSYARINGGNCFDGGGILHPINDAGGGVCNIIAPVEFENGVNTYPAIDNQFAGTINIGGLLWGFSTPYAIGINIASGANAIVESISQLSIPAIQQLVMVGNNLNYSNVPINYPNSDCSFVLASDGYSTPYVDVPGQIQGDVLYFNGTNWTLLPPAQDGYVLTTHGILNNPTWAPASLIAQTAVGLVAAWYVNASTGSDTNDGKTSGTAFRTVEHLSQVLCPNGIQLIIQQNVNVYIAAGSYGKLVLNVTSNDNTLFDIGLVVWGTVSQSITGNVTSVVNTVANGASSIRGQITVASGTLVNHQRISQPPGFLTDQTGAWYTGGAGAIGFSNGLNANAQNSFVTYWCDDNGHYGYTLLTGQPVSVDTLQTTIACLSVEFIGNSWGAIVNCILPDVVKACSSYDTTFNDHFLIIAGCDISGSWTDVHVDFEYCRTVGDIKFNASFVRFFGQSVQHQITGVNQCFLDMHAASFDAGTVVVDTYSEARLFGGEFENGSFGLTAFKVFSTCSVRFDGHIWGVTGLYGVGFDIAADANVTMLGQLSYLQLPSTTNVVIAGNLLPFSAVPVAYPTIGSFFALSDSFDGYLSNNPNIVSFSDSIPFVPNWYVDASIGSDANDGRTSGTAFATTEKLSQILCPLGTNLIIQQNVAVHIAAGTYNSIQLNITSPVGSGFSFDIFCDFTSSAPITLATVTNTVESATPTRGEITTASGTFASGNRIRSTSGAQSGAITYCTGLNGGATDGYVKTWFFESGTTIASVVNVASGTTCVIDTLTTTIQRIQIKLPGHPNGGSTTGTCIIHDAILPNGAEFINEIGGSAGIYVTGCLIGGAGISRFAGNAQIRNSHIIGPGIFTILGTVQLVMLGCLIETSIQAALPIQNSGGCCFNGGSVSCGTSSSELSGTISLAATEWTNGSGLIAVSIFSGCSIQIIGQQYGFGSDYDVGFFMTGGALAITDTVVHLAIPATQQIVMAGNNLLYSAVPIAFPRAACSFALLSDTTALSTAPNKVIATLTGTQAPINIIASPATAAQYTVKAYLEILIAGTLGKLIVNEIHIGPSGTVQTTPITAPIDITIIGNAGQGIVTIATNGTGAIQYSVTNAPGTFTVGSLSYALRISVTQEPN